MRSELKTTSDKSTDPFVDAGVGFFKYFGDSNYGLRADVRYRWLDAGDVAGSNSFGEPVVKIGLVAALGAKPASAAETAKDRSEEHTSELQSLMRISYAVFCLKKKK